jgi:hypothetical protein
MNFLTDVFRSPNADLVTQANLEEIDRRLFGHVHYQNSAAAVWNIQHNLGKRYPIIMIVDSNNIEFGGEIEFIDENNARATFNWSVAGTAICT